jgi:hypothetical protein
VFPITTTPLLLQGGRKGTIYVIVYPTVCREMEKISGGPNFEDFVTILTERLMQDVTVARSRVIFMAIVNVPVHFESDLCRHNKRRICIIQQLLSHLKTSVVEPEPEP